MCELIVSCNDDFAIPSIIVMIRIFIPYKFSEKKCTERFKSIDTVCMVREETIFYFKNGNLLKTDIFQVC